VHLVRFEQTPGTPRLGVLVDDTVIEVTTGAGDDLITAVTQHREEIERAASDTATTYDAAAVRMLAPVPRPRKFLAIAVNYSDHAAELGREPPGFPTFFNKQVTCVVGPGDPVHRPRVSDTLDYEVELGVVIGRKCRHVPVERALSVVAGYCVVNDVTCREWQQKAFTMTIGKSFDTHGPTGPALVTPDEVPDPQNLWLRTEVNDEVLQDGSTRDMIFGVAEQIATLSTSFTLEPGDIIATGTPSGVGVGRKPPRFLQPGDVVRVSVEGLGVLENPVIDEPADTARY
jgi:2-keto-4-pentenoate hydratase/2-oxohepta-3-ene-1,7-dioic acid hydratase in catechol pathway